MQWARVLQRTFAMSTGCSDHLIRLEGTVHSAFEAQTSLKNPKVKLQRQKRLEQN